MFQIISNYAGLFSMILTIAGAIMVARSAGKINAEKSATEAQAKTIDAMQARLDLQSKNIEEMKKENARLEQVFQTICSALKTRGMLISLQGEMISIENVKDGKTTVSRIHDKDMN